MSESTMTINKLGNRIWKNRVGEYHRIDGPAIEWANGDITWCLQGKLIGHGASGFWKFWDRLDEEARQNVNLHMWLRKLTND